MKPIAGYPGAMTAWTVKAREPAVGHWERKVSLSYFTSTLMMTNSLFSWLP